MKRIANRIFRQSLVLLLVFVLLIAILFGFLFAKHTEDIHREDLVRRNELIASTMRDYFKENPDLAKQNRGKNGMNGYGAFLRFLTQIAGEKIWIVDENMNLLMNSSHQSSKIVSNPPQDIQNLVTLAYQDKNTKIDTQQNFFQLEKMTVITPIIDDSNIFGAVIVYSNVNESHQNQWTGYVLLLISLCGATIIASFLARKQAKKFALPITKMKDYVDDLANENYCTSIMIDTQDELGELGKQLAFLSNCLKEAKNTRETKKQAEKDFLSQVSHELRTPVMVIKSSLEIIYDGYLSNEESLEYIHQLIHEVTGLERLVTDLLALSQLESTEFHLEKEEIDILDCINDALRSQRVAFQRKNQIIQFENKLPERQLIVGDYLRLTQMFKILLSNANQYSLSGEDIHLLLRKKKSFLEILLKNPCIQEEQNNLNDLFLLFQRGHHIDTDGSGIGLAIAKQVVVRHHGTISAAVEDNFFIIQILLPFV